MKLFGKKYAAGESLEEKSAKIICDTTNAAVRESYKALRTNIMFSIPKKKCKRIIITSAVSGDGKSTNAINLAITIAETGAKVLLIDCDLRRPNVGNLLKLKQDNGLSNILAGYNTFENTAAFSVRKNMDVIPAGEIPPNPTELLGSEEFKSMIESFSEEYEYIILDTSPVNHVTDAALLSELVDGIVLVVRSGKTQKEELNSAVNTLKLVGAKILGFVFNDAETSGKDLYGNYYSE